MCLTVPIKEQYIHKNTHRLHIEKLTDNITKRHIDRQSARWQKDKQTYWLNIVTKNTDTYINWQTHKTRDRPSYIQTNRQTGLHIDWNTVK